MTPTREVTTALEIASGWLERANLADCVRTRTADLGLVGDVDVVAVGKAAPEMATGATLALGARVTRCFVLSDASGAALAPPGALVATGEHPRPGLASVAAAHQLVDFLATPTSASTTLLLISGGASSL